MNLRELLGEELFAQVQEKVGNGDVELLVNNKKENTYIPKSRLDTVLGQKKVLSDQIDSLEIKLQEVQGDLSNVDTLKTQLAEAQTEIANAKSEVISVRRDAEIKYAVAESGAKNKDVISKLLDKDKVVFKEDGSIEGLKEQLEKLRDDVPELFVTNTPTPGAKGTDDKSPKGTGGQGQEDEDQTPKGGTGSPGNGGKGQGGKPESIGARLAKRKVASDSPAVDFFK